MQGISVGSDWSRLIGQEICQVSIGQNNVDLHWETGSLSICNRFIFKHEDDAIEWTGNEPEIAASLIRLLHKEITEAKCDTEGILELYFSGDESLYIYDSEQFESLILRF